MEVTRDSLFARYSQQDTDSLLALYRSGHLTELAQTTVEEVLKQRNTPLPENPTPQLNPESADDPLKLFWSGKKGTKKTFIVISILGALGDIFLSLLLAKLLPSLPAKLAAFSALTIPYFIFTSIALYRNLPHTKFRLLKSAGLLLAATVITSPFFLYALMSLQNR